MSRLLVLTLLLAGGAWGQLLGPAQGSLVIVGGGLGDPAIWNRFIELAGAPDAPIVVIPTAGGEPDYPQDWNGLEQLRAAGMTNLTVLHTYDPKIADTEQFAKPLETARGVWFPGGRQWRLADSYLDTRVHDEIKKLLGRGGVVGGSSAGATIQGQYLARGDSKTNTIMMGDHEQGFALLRGVAIDQHLLRRNRQFDLLEIIRAQPELLGIGIDEDTAIVVQGDVFEVIGRSLVAIYDARMQIDSGGDFYFLAPGDRFDLASRQATRQGRPLERIVDRQ